MLLFDMMVQVTVGATFALRDREELATSKAPLASKGFRDGLLFGALLYVPSALFFLVAWPGWNSMYLFEFGQQPITTGFYTFGNAAGLFACFILGFHLSAWAIRNGARPKKLLAWLGAAWAAVSVLLFVVLWDRSFAVTSYHDFMSRRADFPRFKLRWGAPDGFFGRPIMWWLLVWAVLDFAPLGFIYWRGRKRVAQAASAESPPARRAAGS